MAADVFEDKRSTMSSDIIDPGQSKGIAMPAMACCDALLQLQTAKLKYPPICAADRWTSVPRVDKRLKQAHKQTGRNGDMDA